MGASEGSTVQAPIRVPHIRASLRGPRGENEDATWQKHLPPPWAGWMEPEQVVTEGDGDQRARRGLWGGQGW